MHITKILCAIDFSESSLCALKKASEISAQCHANLLVLHVLPLSPAFPKDVSGIGKCDRELNEEAARKMDAALRDHVDPQVSVSAVIKMGYPAKEIIAFASEALCELIVISTHGRSGWRHFLLGSVADEVVKGAPCPVLTIRANKEPAKSNEPHKVNLWPDESLFPVDGDSEQKLTFLLHYARLAPSNRNSQPWLWHIEGECIELYADLTRALPAVDPENRELILSCGAALEHLLIALRHFGYEGHAELFPQPEYEEFLAKVTLGRKIEPDGENEILFRAMPLRRSNRHPFRDAEINTPLLCSLTHEVGPSGARLEIITDMETRRKLIELIAHSDRRQGKNHNYVQETIGWLRGDYGVHVDGIPTRSFGEGGLLSQHANDLGEAQAEKDRMLAWSASALVAICTSDDTPRDWIAAGRALARVLLKAAANSLQASFFNSPVEIVEMWPQLHQIAGHKGLPQIIFRLGYPTLEAQQTPRRRVEDILTP